jgi:hypothetical protein
VDFDRDVRPIFQGHCTKCHGAEKREGGLRLSARLPALEGGDGGPVIVPGKSGQSALIRRIASKDAGERMPPKGDGLTPRQIDVLRAWIDQGAAWPGEGMATVHDRRLDHWAFQPVRKPAPPAVKHTALGQAWCRAPIDRFVLAKLDSLGLRPSAEADRRTLIRRLSFDLVGLPPEPERVEAFARDADPLAYEKLVDELLASPHYGERWARHWLDVVHFGETHGYDKDKPRPNAWPYRDYVIRAFNDDKPYGRFVEEQIAGDVLYPGTADGIEALGFISAGPWDFIGHAELPETKIDGMIARHLDRDDMVGNTLGTFCSLTVQCAQCHNHKFDPITQEDYYRLQAVFAALDRADKAYDLDADVTYARANATRLRDDLRSVLKGLDEELGGRRMRLLDTILADVRSGAKAAPRPEFGWHSAIEAKPDVPKWVQVDLGPWQETEPRRIAEIAYVGCHDTFNNIGAGFGFPLRFKIEVSDDVAFVRGVTVVEDQTRADLANPGVVPRTIAVGDRSARYVRFTATKLAPRQNDYIFALAEVEVLDRHGRNLALSAAVTSLDSIEAGPRWGRANLTDGYYFGHATRRTAAQARAIEKDRADLLASAGAGEADARRLAEERAQRAAALAEVEADLQRFPPQRLVYAGTVHHGDGAFRGTGPDGGRPRTIRILARGDVKRPGKEVGAGTIASLAKVMNHVEESLRDSSRLGETRPRDDEGQRRAALARWITDPRHPLTWRSIVNRVWQYHFGRGIVDTPNDFGHMGQRPSHGELLDWLAADFRDGGQSLKRLHRLIVTSAAYRQTSVVGSLREPMPLEERAAHIERAARIDADNVYLWRMNRRKLDAESLRDAVLAVSGQLDTHLGGPSFQDFVIEYPEHSPHYEYHKHDPAEPRAYRRSIYRFIVRSQPQPFMAALDCADPSMRVDKRNESISPAQALALLNDGLMLTMSKHFAARVSAEASVGRRPPDDAAASGAVQQRIRRAYRLALSREPTASESAALTELAQTHGLANACRVIFNLNEFLFVD